MVELANTTLLPFGAFRRRFVVRVWVIAIGFILAAQRQCFLHVSQLCEYCLGASLAETNQSDGCIFPMKLGAWWIFAMVFWKFFPGLRCFPYSGGGSGSFTITASWLRVTDMVTTLSMEAL